MVSNNRINEYSEEKIENMIKQFENEEIKDSKWEGPFIADTIKFSGENLEKTIKTLLFEIKDIEILKQLEDFIHKRRIDLVEI